MAVLDINMFDPTILWWIYKNLFRNIDMEIVNVYNPRHSHSSRNVANYGTIWMLIYQVINDIFI